MAGSSYQDEGGSISEINVTPLVDVVLVLLVIFMVTAPMIAAQGIVMDSPRAATGTAVDGTLTLAINNKGVLVISTELGESTFAADNRLAAKEELQTYQRTHPEAKAIIAGDKSVSHGAVVEVIDMVRSVGIEKFSLRTKPPSKSR